MAKKKKKKKNQSKNYHRTNNCHQYKSDEETFELDDDVIIDNNFSILLNEDREIIVEGILYRYQEDGVFQVEEERIEEFRSYINGGSGQKKSYTDEDFGFQRMDYRIEVFEDCSYGGGGGNGGGNSVTEPDFYEAKLNFSTSEFSKNPSLWGKAFGYARTEIVSLPDKKRMKLKFWNRNYLLFKSFGTEIRFQKRVCFIFCGWQKSYPDKIALGINNLQYNYDQGAETYFSPAVFNSTIYSFNGHNYYPNGQLAPTKIPKVAFPVTELLGGANSLDLFITDPFSDIDFEINMTAEQYANAINSASTALLQFGIDSAIPWLGLKPSSTTTMFTTKFKRNGVSLTISNKNWLAGVENNITKYLDIRVPTITIRADIGASGESFFSNPSIPFPKLNTDNYKTSAVDFYGAVLYKNKWYGKRMVSNDFKRN